MMGRSDSREGCRAMMRSGEGSMKSVRDDKQPSFDANPTDEPMIDSRGEAGFLPVEINELEFNAEKLLVLVKEKRIRRRGRGEGDRSWKQETETVKERKEPVLVMMIKR